RTPVRRYDEGSCGRPIVSTPAATRRSSACSAGLRGASALERRSSATTRPRSVTSTTSPAATSRRYALEPVLQLPHGDGLHGDDVAARGYNVKPRAMSGQAGSPVAGGLFGWVSRMFSRSRVEVQGDHRIIRRAPAQRTPPVIVPALRHPRLKAFSASPIVIISVMGSTGETAKPQLS